jgi:hypothetical protein
MTWEGPGFIYNLYRKENNNEEWELIYMIENPAEGTVEYIDSGLTSGTNYYYSVRITKDGVLLPHSNKFSVMVR